jgi:hypothetical protein
MRFIRTGPWMVGLVAALGMALLPTADQASGCEGLSCLALWVLWLAGVSLVTAAVSFVVYYRSGGRAVARAIGATFGLYFTTWPVLVLATQLYPARATRLTLLDPAFAATCLAAGVVVAALAFWSVAAVRCGDVYLVAFLLLPLLAWAPFLLR